MIIKFTHFCLMFVLALTVGCSSTREFSRGEFEDTQRVNLLSDRFSESTAQILSQGTANQLKACEKLDPNKPSPNVAIETLSNKTDEMAIDMGMVADQIGIALIRSGKYDFIDKPAREALENEYQYNETGVVNVTSRKVRGQQIGVDLLLIGTLSSVVQMVGRDKTVFYQLNVRLTDVNSGKIVCASKEEVRVVFKKNKESN